MYIYTCTCVYSTFDCMPFHTCCVCCVQFVSVEEHVERLLGRLPGFLEACHQFSSSAQQVNSRSATPPDTGSCLFNTVLPPSLSLQSPASVSGSVPPRPPTGGSGDPSGHSPWHALCTLHSALCTISQCRTTTLFTA